MDEGQVRPVTMVAPAPGFAGRVMEQLEARERAAARRRAVIGIGILSAVATGLLFLGGAWMLGNLMDLIAFPEIPMSALVAFMPLVDILTIIADALYVAAVLLVQVGSTQILVYALFVIGLILLWVRMVEASFQWIPHTLRVGGSK